MRGCWLCRLCRLCWLLSQPRSSSKVETRRGEQCQCEKRQNASSRKKKDAERSAPRTLQVGERNRTGRTLHYFFKTKNYRHHSWLAIPCPDWTLIDTFDITLSSICALEKFSIIYPVPEACALELPPPPPGPSRRELLQIAARHGH